MLAHLLRPWRSPLRTVPSEAELPEDIRTRILAVQDKAGFVPNVFWALAHRPDEFRAFFAYHDALMDKPGPITKVGLETFVDPRLGGGKINPAATPDDLVELLTLGGEEWLHYKAIPLDVVFIRGTTADPFGNVTMEREALTLDGLAMATAARNSGGLVIVQVERIAERGSLNPRQVKIPGALVDCVVVGAPGSQPHWKLSRNT